MKFNLVNDKGSYCISFRLEGKRRRFYPGTSDEAIAKQVVRRMTYEWEQGQFDLSLKSYKLSSKTQPEIAVEVEPQDLLAIWDLWVAQLDISDSTKNGHYASIRSNIKKHQPKAHDVQWFLLFRSELLSRTWLIKRSYLKTCIDWATRENLFIGKNPYEGIKPLRNKIAPDRIKPFSSEEISKILEALDSNRFVGSRNQFKHSYYSSFVRFLFITGCRLGEAIGLTWDCVDFETKTVVIKQALGRDLAAGQGTARKILKPTKTGAVHYIPMNEALFDLLKAHESPKEGYVFPGYKGGYISVSSFRRGAWKDVLEGLEIEYRYPYQIRHTALSSVAKNHGLAASAALAGHKDLTMASKHYIKFVGDLKDVLPTLPF